jgi:hypothetical protein
MLKIYKNNMRLIFQVSGLSKEGWQPLLLPLIVNYEACCHYLHLCGVNKTLCASIPTHGNVDCQNITDSELYMTLLSFCLLLVKELVGQHIVPVVMVFVLCIITVVHTIQS